MAIGHAVHGAPAAAKFNHAGAVRVRRGGVGQMSFVLRHCAIAAVIGLRVARCVWPWISDRVSFRAQPRQRRIVAQHQQVHPDARFHDIETRADQTLRVGGRPGAHAQHARWRDGGGGWGWRGGDGLARGGKAQGGDQPGGGKKFERHDGSIVAWQV